MNSPPRYQSKSCPTLSSGWAVNPSRDIERLATTELMRTQTDEGDEVHRSTTTRRGRVPWTCREPGCARGPGRRRELTRLATPVATRIATMAPRETPVEISGTAGTC